MFGGLVVRAIFFSSETVSALCSGLLVFYDGEYWPCPLEMCSGALVFLPSSDVSGSKDQCFGTGPYLPSDVDCIWLIDVHSLGFEAKTHKNGLGSKVGELLGGFLRVDSKHYITFTTFHNLLHVQHTLFTSKTFIGIQTTFISHNKTTYIGFIFP